MLVLAMVTVTVTVTVTGMAMAMIAGMIRMGPTQAPVLRSLVYRLEFHPEGIDMNLDMARIVVMVMAVFVFVGQTLAVETTHPMSVFTGSWVGTSKHGTRFEVRVDSVGEDGLVRGARCDMRKSWIDTVMPLAAMNAVARDVYGRKTIVMKVTEAQVKLRVVGDAGETRLQLVDENTLAYTLTPSAPARKRGVRGRDFRMERASELPCLDRYSVRPITAPAPSGGDALPIIGYWSFPLPTRKFIELAISGISPAGIVEGRFCVKVRSTGDIQIVDLELTALPRYRATYDDAAQSITFERNRIERGGKRRRDRWVMALTDDGQLTMEITNRFASARAKTWTATLERGADPQGCLLQTTQRPSLG